MYKRILPLLLVAVTLFSCATLPVSASEGAYVDILDFCAPNDMGYTLTFRYAATVHFDYSKTLFAVSVYDYEIEISATGAEPVLTNINYYGDQEFTTDTTAIGKVYRGNADGDSSAYWYLDFQSDGDTSITFLSFKVYLTRYTFTNLPGVLYTISETINLPKGGTATVHAPTFTDPFGIQFGILIDKGYWADLDVIEVTGCLSALALDSITAFTVDNQYLPVYTNYITPGVQFDPSDPATQMFYFSVSVDISDIDVSKTEGQLQLLFSALVGNTQAFMTVFSLRGLYTTETIDPEIRWYTTIWREIVKVYDRIESIDINFTDFFSVFVDLFDALIESVYLPVAEAVSSLDQKITDFFEFDISDPFDPEKNNSLWSTIVYYLDNIYNKVVSGFDRVVDVLSPDPVDDEVTNQMQQAGSEMSGMTQQMQQAAPTPNVGDINVDIDSLVDPSAMGSATVLMSTITNIPFIQQLLLIIVSFALIGFVFFGKR